MPPKGYTSISLPDEMVKEIDKLVANRRYGYTSRADVVADAIRRLMEELKPLSR
jgi:metal-responsive CopG/Arc/MetJ family transcriptional regulator